MDRNPTIVFVCEHGAAKSVIGAAYFNRIAAQVGSEVRAIARGTHPDRELSPSAVKGLTQDGLPIIESAPQKLTPADIQLAQRVITFCDLPKEVQSGAIIDRWDDIPAVSENYEKARDAILKRIRFMLSP